VSICSRHRNALSNLLHSQKLDLGCKALTGISVNPSTGVPSNPCCLDDVLPFFCKNSGVEDTKPWLRFIATNYNNNMHKLHVLMTTGGLIMAFAVSDRLHITASKAR
jgi:hypothetical protein